jgi:hypothetical protein
VLPPRLVSTTATEPGRPIKRLDTRDGRWLDR